MVSKSLNKIITEEEFLPLVQEPCDFFFKIYNKFILKIESDKEISKKFYSNLIQEADFLECFLDEHGARENKKWYAFTEYVASIRNLGIAAFFIKHVLDRLPRYNLLESEETVARFQSEALRTLDFLNRSIRNLYQELIRTGKANGVSLTTETPAGHELTEVETNKRLPHTLAEDEVKKEEERIIDLCEKIQKTAEMMKKIKIENTEDVAELKRIVPYRMDEKKARNLKNMVHSVQSDFDTYVKNTRLEQDHPDLKKLRGFISMPLHLLEVTLWLCHFYERHEDEIRQDESKRKITAMVNKNELLGTIVNFAFHFAMEFLQEGARLSRKIRSSFTKTVRYELPIPTPLGFHARPSTYISLIARQYEVDDVYLVVDGEKFNAKSVMSLLQAGGLIADKGYQTAVFEGDKRVLDDIKILAEHNYCEEKEIPRQLSYLRVLRNTA